MMQGEFVKKFRIPIIPPTTNKCIRFPNDVIERVEESIKGKDCTIFGVCNRSRASGAL